ncbi:hypothetical protein E2C01_010741 [Portunus trituberculatus]|uniref:Uncharacterized protein n=1 Tax=Portunus trituberculatus TaxID=210409 RepID=A0A5B7D9G0_PORTR|nr:hypothetical protein [Portunus trituberculatus]
MTDLSQQYSPPKPLPPMGRSTHLSILWTPTPTTSVPRSTTTKTVKALTLVGSSLGTTYLSVPELQSCLGGPQHMKVRPTHKQTIQPKLLLLWPVQSKLLLVANDWYALGHCSSRCGQGGVGVCS